jgi:RimJ/RimL family protein N-acetyltransferase
MIEVRRFERCDFDRLIEWSPTAEFLLQWAGPFFTWPLDEEQLERYLESADGDEPIRQIFKVLATETGEVVGHIELGNIDRRNRCATVNRVLVGDSAYRGRGYGEAMAREVVRIGFEEFGLHRLELVVFDFNHAARACYEKVGFRVEGHIRESRRIGDEFWSLYVMGMLEDEWRSEGM